MSASTSPRPSSGRAGLTSSAPAAVGPAPGDRPFLVTRGRGGAAGRGVFVAPEGITESALRSRRYRRLFHGVYVRADVPVTTALRAEAALLLAGDQAAASHETAAELWGGIVPASPLTHVTAPSPRPRVQGIKAHRVGAGSAWCTQGNVRLTMPESTFVDLARSLGLVDLVVLGDSLVRKGVVRPDELVDAAARPRSPALGRRAAGLVRAGAESPSESRLRVLLVLAGLPEPVVNRELRDEQAGAARTTYRLDLSYPSARLAIEYDGRQHAESTAQWTSDIARREWLDRNGWRLVVVTSAGIYRQPAETVRRVVAAMHDLKMPVPRLRDDWRHHFGS